MQGLGITMNDEWSDVVNDSYITSGRNSSTTISTIKKLCDGLEISNIDFFQADVFQNLEQELK